MATCRPVTAATPPDGGNGDSSSSDEQADVNDPAFTIPGADASELSDNTGGVVERLATDEDFARAKVKCQLGRLESKSKFKFADDQPGTKMEEGESYSKADVELALARVADGEKKADVAPTSPVPLRTLFRLVKRAGDTSYSGPSRRGPKPVVPEELENDLAEWMAAMQRCGVPVGRKEIIAKASAMLVVATACPFPTRNTTTRVLTGGWYRRFLQRHPSLSNRIAQCIARVRNSVDGEGVSTLFYTLAKLFIEMNIDSIRVFNMDETSFMPKTARRKVVAVRGSANVWRKETKPSFHMTVVGAVSAAGASILPLLIVPGVRLSKEEFAALSIKGSAITGAPKGFSNKRSSSSG
ncbi:hypothetical protein BBJ28_00020166 [Nothophytophthora sp. Chile5]|nr:hypothetical protein BBJ28_00020166 [Nothophytophthora sp. Chile5]